MFVFLSKYFLKGKAGCFFCTNIGIIFEIIGGSYLVVSTFYTRMKMAQLTTDIDHIDTAVNSLISEVKGQFTNQMICFGLLITGLIIRIIKNMKNNMR